MTKKKWRKELALSIVPFNIITFSIAYKITESTAKTEYSNNFNFNYIED